MLDVTVDIAHNMHVRVFGTLADNTAAPYYCLLLCVNTTLEDGGEVCMCVRNAQSYIADVDPQDALNGLLADACYMVGVTRYRHAQAQIQNALRRWLAREIA